MIYFQFVPRITGLSSFLQKRSSDTAAVHDYNYVHFHTCSCKVNRLRTGLYTVRLPTGATDFLFFPERHNYSWAHAASFSVGAEA